MRSGLRSWRVTPRYTYGVVHLRWPRAGNTSDSHILVGIADSEVMMTRGRRMVLFLLLLAAVSPPFLSERHVQPQVSPAPPMPSEPHLPPSPQSQHLLLTPSFFLHFAWIFGLVLLGAITLLDLILKFVYVGCTFGVNCCTAQKTFPVYR